MKLFAIGIAVTLSLFLAACGGGERAAEEPVSRVGLMPEVEPPALPEPMPQAEPEAKPAPIPEVGPETLVAPRPSLRKLPKPKPKPEPVDQVQAQPEPVDQAQASRLKGPWGIYRGNLDQLWPAYEQAQGSEKSLLKEIANLPRASKWFTSSIGPNEIEGKIEDYIVNSQAGDRKKLVQITIFRMDPWYTASQSQVPSPKQVSEYKLWIRNSAKAIGSTRTALYLQPDSTFLRGVPNYELSTSLIRYAARIYGRLPNTLVYLETGGYDWPAPGQGGAPEAARLLRDSGIKFADGIVTNTTHYNSVELDIQRVGELVEIFNAEGITGLKGVINTSSGGNGFEFGTYTGPDPDNAFVCESYPYSGTCVALGIPPTWDVANPRWGLSPEAAAMATKYIDAYAWVGRPWLYRQADPFQMERAVPLIQNWQFR